MSRAPSHLMHGRSSWSPTSEVDVVGILRVGIVLLAIILVLIARPASAQDGSVGDPAADASPSTGTDSTTQEEPSLEDRAEQIIDSLHKRGIYPKVGSIEAGSGASFGGRLRDPFLVGPVGIEAEGMLSIRGYQAYALRMGLIGQSRDMMQLGGPGTNVTQMFSDHERLQPGTAFFLMASHQRSPRVDFFGLNGIVGPQSDFALSRASLELVGQWQPLTWLGVSARGGITEFRVSAGRNDETANVTEAYSAASTPGLLDQPRYWTIGLAATGDTRDNPWLPTHGVFTGAALWRMIGDSGTDQTFLRAAVDVRTFTPLWSSTKHVAAFRFLGALDNSPATSPTPFYLQYWLGGSNTLRGYTSYQVRGEALAHVTAEYRWHMFRRIELVAFADVGSVASNVRGLANSDWHASPGLGVWLRGTERLYFRVDVAHGRDGYRWLWSLNPSF